jgi:hypothetical protein
MSKVHLVVCVRKALQGCRARKLARRVPEAVPRPLAGRRPLRDRAPERCLDLNSTYLGGGLVRSDQLRTLLVAVRRSAFSAATLLVVFQSCGGGGSGY